jgi:hypothetical protein
MLSNIHHCNNIDTIAFSGGGNFGILYLGVIKYLEDNNILAGINKYYGVSVGSMSALALSVGYTYNELYDLLINEFNYKDILKFELKDTLNITKSFGINNGYKMETLLKTALEKKGINPYITLKGLYELTGKELNIGTTALIAKKFILLNHKTYPDLQVWLAIRMSTCIPIIFTPIKDENTNEIYVDGCLLNNLPINIIIKDILSKSNSLISTDTTTDTSTSTETVEYCYKHNFICINLLNNNSYTDICNMSITNYIECIIKTIFVNQSYNKPKYKPYIIYIDCNDYTNIGDLFAETSISDINNAINNIYNQFIIDFNNVVMLDNNKSDDIDEKTNEIDNKSDDIDEKTIDIDDKEEK